MSLVNFLVTSDTRRELLRLLWCEKVEASGHQLAQLARAAYSAAHSELQKMKKEGLVTYRLVGRAAVFRRNESYPEHRTLERLLVCAEKNKAVENMSDEIVRLNLVKFGAPLNVHGSSQTDSDLERTLVAALQLSRHDPSVARALPLVFAKNQKVLNLPRLEFFARERGSVPVLGLFLDITGMLSHSSLFRLEAKRLFDHRRKRFEDFFVGRRRSQFEQRLTERNTPPVARNWRFWLNMGMDSFETLFKKHWFERETLVS